jgi:HEAT repeat protein
VDELVQILENRGSSMRVDAIEALSAIGDEKAVPSLLKVLGEKGSRQVAVEFK